MARTGDRVVVSGGKSSAKKGKGGGGSTKPSQSASTSSSSSPANSSAGGGNPICPRETPAWQKPITTFFQKIDGGKPEKERSGPKEPIADNEMKTLNGQEPTKMIMDKQENSKETVSKNAEVEEVKPTVVSEKENAENEESIEKVSENTSGNETPMKKFILLNTDTKENDDIEVVNACSCKTPTSGKKRKSKHINILTPRRKKVEKLDL